jgi:hypothetical protein
MECAVALLIVVPVCITVCFLASVAWCKNKNADQVQAFATMLRAFAQIIRAMWGRKP